MTSPGPLEMSCKDCIAHPGPLEMSCNDCMAHSGPLEMPCNDCMALLAHWKCLAMIVWPILAHWKCLAMIVWPSWPAGNVSFNDCMVTLLYFHFCPTHNTFYWEISISWLNWCFYRNAAASVVLEQ